MIDDVLHKIQKDLKAPKNQYNKFGGYNYRSCEDIVEAVKKLLPDGVALVMSDSLCEFGGRVFVKATARLKSSESVIEASGCAEVAIEQKGMQAAQITGSASSYARKYALNGLFCIDDTKDDDSNEKTQHRKNVESGDAKEKAQMWLDSNIGSLLETEDIDHFNKWITKNKPYLDKLDNYPDVKREYDKKATDHMNRIMDNDAARKV